VLYRKQLVENANMAKVKTKKAGKMATRRLKVAKKKMHENDKAGFYDEVLKALWGYLSDKLCMPVSELSKDNVAVKLRDSLWEDRASHQIILEQYIGLVNTYFFEFFIHNYKFLMLLLKRRVMQS
jgi:hypothetical protein